MFGLILGIASLGMGLIQGISGASAAREQARQAKENAEYNAEQLERQAAREGAERGAEEIEERRQAKKNRARMEAMYAKSGILLTGTPAQMLIEQAGDDEFNVQEGNRASTQKIIDLKDQADITRQQGIFQSDALKTKANATLFSGVASGALGAASAYGDYGGIAKTNPTTSYKVNGAPSRNALAADMYDLEGF